MILLASGTNTMEKVVNEQLIMAWQMVFGMCDFETEIAVEKVRDFMEEADSINTDSDIDEETVLAVKEYLEKIFECLTDEKHEYIFEDFASFMIQEVIFILDNIYVEDLWDASVDYMTRKQLYEDCQNYVATIAEEMGDEDDESTINTENDAESLYYTMTHLPYLSAGRGYEYFLWFDYDFMAYRGWQPMIGKIPEIVAEEYIVEGF